jgi:glutaminyl-tRNA synthetase
MNEPKADVQKKKASDTTVPTNFIKQIIDEDIKANKNDGRVHTRFPPEPNGYLHIGHAKSICLNFGIAEEYNGLCNLRYDDTDPAKEEVEYVESIKQDVRWLGFDWENREYYASDYFEQLFEYAVQLIKAGKAYVDSLTAEEIREYRGTLTQPGKDSPYRERSIEDNLDLFERMRAGEYKDGEHVLRAKIDMASPNMIMRDPTLYRIKHVSHYRTGGMWCIYPMYDFTHCLSDSIEGITHSICTLEFEINRALYDWVLDQLDVYHPQQIEFARLNLSFTVLSKRKLIRLVEEGHVSGWDDPRMPTLSGIRRRGYTPEAIRNFCERIGVAKADSMVDMALLEYCIREDLNKHAPRVKTTRKTKKKSWRPSTTLKIPPWAPARYLFHVTCISNRMISWKIHPKNSSAWPPVAKSGCDMPSLLPVWMLSETRTPVRSSSYAVPTILKPVVATPLTDAKSKERCTAFCEGKPQRCGKRQGFHGCH